MTTPLVMAREQCANFMKLEHPAITGCFREADGKCKLAKAGARCGYFEKCVLPLATRRAPYADGRYAAVPGNHWRGIARKSGVGLLGLAVTISASRKCECGALIGARERYCASCRVRRRRETKRRNDRKRRKSAVLERTAKPLAGIAQQ